MTTASRIYKSFCRSRPRAYLPVATDHGGNGLVAGLPKRELAVGGSSIGGMARKSLRTTELVVSKLK